MLSEETASSSKWKKIIIWLNKFLIKKINQYLLRIKKIYFGTYKFNKRLSFSCFHEKRINARQSI